MKTATKLYDFRLNGRKFESGEIHPTGNDILGIAGLVPPEDYELLLKLTDKEFEPVQLNEKVDLGQQGLETFIAAPYKDLKILVDDEPVNVKECFLTPDQILEKIGKAPDGYYLKQIEGHKEVTYKNDRDHMIVIKKHQRFTTCKREGTTVS